MKVTPELQKKRSLAASVNRIATVSFTNCFSLLKIREQAIFNALVVLQLQTADNIHEISEVKKMPSISVPAIGKLVSTAFENTFLESPLDEDKDELIDLDQNGRPYNIYLGDQLDDWKIMVTLPLFIQKICRSSLLVTGI